MRNSIFPFLLCLLAGAALIPGCSVALPDLFDNDGQNAHTQSTPTPTATPRAALTVEPDAPEANLQNRLIVWVPEEFDPRSGPAGQMFQDQVDAFAAANPGLEVEVRVKSMYGPAGMLTSLEKSLQIAPLAAPALVLLPQNAFEAAVRQGLVHSSPQLGEWLNGEDWYDFARQLAQVQNQVFGLPFAADALVFTYRPAALSGPPSDWESILSDGSPLLFAAGDADGLLPLNLYLSSGGAIHDDLRQASLDLAALQQVLELFKRGADVGAFPPRTMQLETGKQAWSALQQKTTNLSISWISDYLLAFPADIAAATVPPLGSESITLVTGWLWALSDPYPERQATSLRLLEHLTGSDFMAAWTLQAGHLPVRPSGMTVWENQVTNALLRQVTVSAQNLPPDETMAVIVPILNEAVYNVVINGYLPYEAARIAVNAVQNR